MVLVVVSNHLAILPSAVKQCLDDLASHLVLAGKDVFQAAVEAFRPQVIAAHRIDHPYADAHAAGGAFPMLPKIAVTGPNKHPLYETLIAAQAEAEFTENSALLKLLPQREPEPGVIHWNFEKFLIGRDGAVLARFAPDTRPEDETVVHAIERALAASEGRIN